MKIIKPSYEILYPNQDQAHEMFLLIERAGRTCYKSENKITDDSAASFVRMLIDRGHMAMLEHNMLSVKFVADRGYSHELVRHRLAAFAQESTRYVNYKNGMEVICPDEIRDNPDQTIYNVWYTAMLAAEHGYKLLIEAGLKPQIARSVLPTCLKTEIIITANWREWMHIFTMRTPHTAHPQMRELMIPLLEDMRNLVPVVFDKIDH